ncbi:copper resistance CopC family protein [Vallicoccus soli]|uniref:Copper resistance protein CopC n=1 Tax=Vallicoccus soli TaxID=2339232 RepID=A0A3A3YTJ3_9ACTN|nr:copper resistance CopC family protein [Vallicoccus soli]RJK94794.1 copper resistance protein CopC [Vallicoccus soli]
MSPRTAAARRLAAGALALGAASTGAVLGAGPAAAHASLSSTEPADGASLQAAPGVVRLVFDEAVQSGLATVVVEGPGGPAAEGAPEVLDGTVEQAVAAAGDGDYRVAFRVVSADGHPVSGEVRFTVEGGAGAPAGAGAGAPEPSEGPSQAPPSGPAAVPGATPGAEGTPAAGALGAPGAAGAVGGADGGEGADAAAGADEGGGHAQHLVPLAAVAAAAVVVVAVTTFTGRRDRRR